MSAERGKPIFLGGGNPHALDGLFFEPVEDTGTDPEAWRDEPPAEPEPADEPRCAVCGGPDADGNGCEYCPAVTADERIAELRSVSNDGLRNIIDHEREQGRAFGQLAEAARILIELRGDPGTPS